MKQVILIVCLYFACIPLFAQRVDTTAHVMQEVIVTGLKETQRSETAMDISEMTTADMRRLASFNISDALTRIPGISQLSTGLAISKPVVRGLYGNRILVLLSGLRFDNQQWQDEHGMGLSDIGIDRVEVIKGPMAVLYGTDAVGAVINVIEEKRAQEGKIEVDFNTRFHSNTLGTLTDIGIKGARNNIWWRVRAGVENHADYSDGNNTRVLNSRSDGYYLKGTFGAEGKNWSSENNYHFSYNDFGFILGDIRQFMTEDARWTRKLNGPFHRVILNVISSRNRINLKNSILKIDGGFQSNSRAENEGGGQISLNMLLTSALYHLEWIKPVKDNLEFILSQNSSYENNTNYGARKLIPDAHIFQANVSGYIKYHTKIITIETGAGVNADYIKTLLTPLVNTPDRDIHPFSRFRASANGLFGITINPTEGFNIKFNAATGLRAPNLAELSSNGLREGTYHFEIGDVNLKNEQNLNLDLCISQNAKWFGYSVSGYVNMFSKFIYLTPTSETIYGFNIYRYRQQNAIFTGTDGEVYFTPQGALRGLQLDLEGSYIYSIGRDGNYIPFTPAPKLSPSISYTRDLTKNVKGFFVKLGFDRVFAQNRIAPGEIATPAYYLMNASIGSEVILKKCRLILSITGLNLLNQAYYDHLSRLKEFGLLNMGRDIAFNISIPLSFNYPNKNQKPKP